MVIHNVYVRSCATTRAKKHSCNTALIFLNGNNRDYPQFTKKRLIVRSICSYTQQLAQLFRFGCSRFI